MHDVFIFSFITYLFGLIYFTNKLSNINRVNRVYRMSLNIHKYKI
jgi:hypothetical protein